MMLWLWACAPKIEIIYEQENRTHIDIQGRLYIDEFQVPLQIRNVGNSTAYLEQITISDLFTENVELPLEIAPSQSIDLTLFFLPQSAGSYLEEIAFGGNFPTQNISVVGEIEPYVQIQLQELPDVDVALQEEFTLQGLIGAGVAIVEGQDIIYMKGQGFANKDEEVAVDPSVHRFRWASLSKGLTSYVAMQQVENGKLDIDTPISTYMDYIQPELYLPEGCTDETCALSVPEDRADISLRLLLSHTAGIQHYSNGVGTPVPPITEAADDAINTGMEWALPLFLSKPLVEVPKTAYNYSTFGYNLAGVVIEKAIERSLDELVHQSLSVPAGIETLTPDRQWDPQPNRVVGYDRYNDTIYVSGDTDVSWKLAGGGFQSTVEDLARYCAVLLGDDLLTEESKEKMWQVQEMANNYALGFEINQEQNVVFHSGAQQSTRTGLVVERSSNRCYVAMSNSTWAKPIQLIRALRDVH